MEIDDFLNSISEGCCGGVVIDREAFDREANRRLRGLRLKHKFLGIIGEVLAIDDQYIYVDVKDVPRIPDCDWGDYELTD